MFKTMFKANDKFKNNELNNECVYEAEVKSKNKIDGLTFNFKTNFKLKFVFLFLLLLLSTFSSSTTVFAGRVEQEKEDNITLNDELYKNRLAEYATFVSHPGLCEEAQTKGLLEGIGINTNVYSKYGDRYDLDMPDENAKIVEWVDLGSGRTELRSYAALVDPNTGGRTNTSNVSESVQEFQGYYFYDIKISTWAEDENGLVEPANSYTRRIYFKYVELKKEIRGQDSATSRGAIYGNDKTENGGNGKSCNNNTDVSTGIWLYFLSNKTTDDVKNGLTSIDGEEKNPSTETGLMLIDVFTGSALDEDRLPYWENLFMWPMSSVTCGDLRMEDSALQDCFKTYIGIDFTKVTMKADVRYCSNSNM